MRKSNLVKLVCTATLGFVTLGHSFAQHKKHSWDVIDTAGIVSSDTIKKDGITLVFINKDPNFDPVVAKRMEETFFTIYPKECKVYNPKSRKDVTMFIDPTYDGVAATGGGLIRVNPEWMHKHPEDIDVVTHEAMHIVQGYPRYEPIWVTEGIADYVRATLGVDNEGANWKLPDYNPKQSYKNSYRITARFFIWLTKNKNKLIIEKLDAAMRDNTYSDAFWKKQTGKTIDELWAEYGANPVI